MGARVQPESPEEIRDRAKEKGTFFIILAFGCDVVFEAIATNWLKWLQTSRLEANFFPEWTRPHILSGGHFTPS